MGEDICTDISDKGLVSKIYRETSQTQHPKNKDSSEEMGKRHE